MSKASLYLDYAAATPVDEAVLQAMQPYFVEQFYNPSATYSLALQVHKDLEAARAKVAHWLGARPSEVIFTAGGTEANNLAIHGVMRQYPQANVVVSGVEHESVLAPAGNYDCREIAVLPDGRLNIDDLKTRIDDQTVLVSVMYANNEVGTIQPLREVAQVVAAIRQARQKAGNTIPLLLHSDACQTANFLDLHVARLGVDLLTLNGGKIYGPKQSGVLFVKAGLQLQPLIQGGGQERNIRSGTENVAASIGFSVALDKAQTTRQAETKRLQTLQQQMLKLINEQLPAAIINGSQKHRLPNNIHLTIPGSDNERLLIQLDEVGIQAAAGSACSASDEEPSHVLKAMGISDADAQASLRLTMGRQTDSVGLEQVVRHLRQFA